ncbi:MAG: hypothetical protein JWM34_2804 [Ilumatobacteraceae bacterium]|nr:hypothetical protein [Ilumatobacteraceae bacterium]
MGDAIFVLATLVFFGICVAYVNWCDRIIGPDDFGPGDAEADLAAAGMSATSTAKNPTDNTEVTA